LKTKVDVPLILILLFATALRVLYITSPLAEAHRWRQTFNADVARQFLQISFDIFHPRVNWGGADGVVAMEFPLVPAMIAGLFAITGERPAVARGLTVAFSLGTCVLLYLLGRDLAGRGAGRGAAFVFAASPSGVFFGQAVMVDVPMLFFSAGALLGYLRYLESNSRRALLLGSAALALAGLVKLPNVLIVGPIVYLGWAVRGWRIAKDRRFVVSVVIALALIAAWYWHADVIFHRTGLGVAAFHAAGTYGPEVAIAAGPMSPVSSWSTAARIMDPDFYWRMLARFWDLHLTPPGLALALVGIALAFRSFRESMLVVWLAAVAAFILATAEGNYWHEYHQLPILLPAALLAGLAAAPAFDLFRGSLWPFREVRVGSRLVAVGVAVAIGLVAVMSFQRSDVINTLFRPNTLDRNRMNAGAAIAAEIFSATMMVGMLVLARGTVGISDASTTRRPSMPCTRPAGSTTASRSSAGPIRQVPATWNMPATFCRICSASPSSSFTSAVRSILRSASVPNTGSARAGTMSVSPAMIRALAALDEVFTLSWRSRSVNFTGKFTPYRPRIFR
jgi:4-amino-4-deoxy-L-arabinose transferase-like glycosyltransferase